MGGAEVRAAAAGEAAAPRQVGAEAGREAGGRVEEGGRCPCCHPRRRRQLLGEERRREKAAGPGEEQEADPEEKKMPEVVRVAEKQVALWRRVRQRPSGSRGAWPLHPQWGKRLSLPVGEAAEAAWVTHSLWGKPPALWAMQPPMLHQLALKLRAMEAALSMTQEQVSEQRQQPRLALKGEVLPLGIAPQEGGLAGRDSEPRSWPQVEPRLTAHVLDPRLEKRLLRDSPLRQQASQRLLRSIGEL